MPPFQKAQFDSYNDFKSGTATFAAIIASFFMAGIRNGFRLISTFPPMKTFFSCADHAPGSDFLFAASEETDRFAETGLTE
jgi:hypothetical protein